MNTGGTVPPVRIRWCKIITHRIMEDIRMNETRKIEEQTKEELLKEHELSLEDLEKVSGGDSRTRETLNKAG